MLSRALSNLLYSIIVGLVQGVSEWLPISSKTQVLLVSSFLFGFPLTVAYAFGLFMEVGSLVAALAYFRKDILSLFHDRKLLVFLLVVTIITGLEGVPLYLLSEKLLANAYNLGYPMMVLGAFLIFDGLYIRYSRKQPHSGSLGTLSWKQYLIIGAAQGLAALPGVSRSGMTVSTMLFMRVAPREAFKLSYLAYMPASLGGFLTTIVFSRPEIGTALTTFDASGIAVALATAAVTSFIVIGALLRFARTKHVYIITLFLGVVAISLGAIVATFNLTPGLLPT